MERREFLKAVGAAALVPSALREGQPTPGATVLYDGRAVTLSDVRPDPGGVPDSLWILKNDPARINEFELKPEGACRADVRIPVPPTMIEVTNSTSRLSRGEQGRAWLRIPPPGSGASARCPSSVAPSSSRASRLRSRCPIGRANSFACRSSAARKCSWSRGPPGEDADLICQVGRHWTTNSRTRTSRSSRRRRIRAAKRQQENGTRRQTDLHDAHRRQPRREFGLSIHECSHRHLDRRARTRRTTGGAGMDDQSNEHLCGQTVSD